MDQRLDGARQAIHDGRYDVALRRLNEVLELEPRNVWALELLGTAHYLRGEWGLARKAWERVLEIEPGNREVAEFLGRLGRNGE